MKPRGGQNSDSASRIRKANHYAAKVVKKRKEEALRRGTMVRKLPISHRIHHSPGHRQQPRPSEAGRALPTDCVALLDNHSNAGRSGPPARILFYRNRSWKDLPSDAAESLKRAFIAGMLSSVVEIGRRSYLFDFLRMLQFDMKAGTTRSIAWIDVDGKCFFPRKFVAEEEGDVGGSRPLKVEIKVAIKGGSKAYDESEGQPGNAPPNECGRIVASIPDLNQSEQGGSGNAAERIVITVPLPHRVGDAASRWKGKAVVDDSWAEENHGGHGNRANMEEARDGGNVIVLDNDDENAHGGGISLASFNGNNTSNELRLDKQRRLTSVPETGAAIDGPAAVIPSPETAGVELTGCAELVLLEESHPAYKTVKDLFLAGMKTMDANTKVVSVHWCAHRDRQSNARMHAFQRYADEMKAVRGSANVRFAWLASSPKIVDGVVVRGLGKVEARTGSESYGVGVYLSAKAYPQLSASYSKPVADGKCTLVLCRVILGSMEQLFWGTHQSGPRSDDFDSGVDNLRDPKLYIIRKNRMNTHVFPEYVVTFKVLEYRQDLWARRSLMPSAYAAMSSLTGALTEIPVLKASALAILQSAVRAPAQSMERLPVSNGMPNMSFQALFAGIRGQLSEVSFERLVSMYEDCKAGKIQKNVLVRAMRAIVGDKLLIASVLNFNKGSLAPGARRG